MSAHDVILALLTAGVAWGGDWTPLGDHGAHPACEQRSCVIDEGPRKFEIAMVTEEKEGLTYLRRIEIKDRLSGKSQSFATPAVNAAEGGRAFEIFAVRLCGGGVKDLALLAYDSAGAGPSYYYYLYDGANHAFRASNGTIPKLGRDPKTGALRTDVQGVEFVIDGNVLKEK